ncbi:hypothetical protein D3C80_705360 [compost metagenome]
MVALDELIELGVLASFGHEGANLFQTLFGRHGLVPLQFHFHAIGNCHVGGFLDIQEVRLDTCERDMEAIVAVEQVAQFVEQLFYPQLQARLFVARQLAAICRSLVVDRESRFDSEGVVRDMDAVHGFLIV